MIDEAHRQKLGDVSQANFVFLYGTRKCKKTKSYEQALCERGVAYTFRDVGKDDQAAAELSAIYDDEPGSSEKFPTILIEGKRLRNPPLRDLVRALAHATLFDPGLVHEPKAKRFVRYMKPRDAFVSYSETEHTITLGHIEVPNEKRGSGIGERLALEAFSLAKKIGKQVKIRCPFLRKVASSDSDWSEYFNI